MDSNRALEAAKALARSERKERCNTLTPAHMLIPTVCIKSTQTEARYRDCGRNLNLACPAPRFPIGLSDGLGGHTMQPSKQITAKKGPWTKDDVRRLRLLADANISAVSIARFLGRSRASVTLKARWLKLPLAQKEQLSTPSERLEAARMQRRPT